MLKSVFIAMLFVVAANLSPDTDCLNVVGSADTDSYNVVGSADTDCY